MTYEINNEVPVENLFTIMSHPNLHISLAALIAFIGGRAVISDLYEKRPDILCNPYIKILILFCIIYMNVKHFYYSLILFILYIMFIDNYLIECSSDNFGKKK